MEDYVVMVRRKSGVIDTYQQKAENIVGAINLTIHEYILRNKESIGTASVVYAAVKEIDLNA